MNAMKRTFLVGASMFALISGVSAQADAQSLEAYQATWKKSHNVTEMTPAHYEQMKSDWVQSKTSEKRITRAEIEAQETVMKTTQILESRGLPEGFPVKQNTGDLATDAAAYKAAKDLWIQNNPELYKQMLTTNKATATEREAIRNQERNNQIK